MRRRVWVFLLAGVLAVPASPVAGQTLIPLAESERPDRLGHVPGEVVVKWREGRPGPRVQVLPLRRGEHPQAAAASLSARPDVEFAEPNWYYRASYVPNDPSFPSQWGLGRIAAPAAWDLERGLSSRVQVAVIDSGIDRGHPEFAGRVLPGKNYCGISMVYANAAWAMWTGRLAQSIRGTGDILNSVTFLLSKKGSPADGIAVSLRTSLDGAVLAAARIPPSAVRTDYTEVRARFPRGLRLSAGKRYFLVLQFPQSSSFFNFYSCALNWPGGTGALPNPYREGNSYHFAGSWASDTKDDLYFRTNPTLNPRDDNGHGTHVAGIIGAAGDNGLGIAGVSWGARIRPVKVLSSSGMGTSADVADGIRFAADRGARVINLSLGGRYSRLIRDAVAYARGRGAMIFAAAGNTGDATVSFPAGVPGVIGVGATTRLDQRAVFSSYNRTVDLAAPGERILSTLPRYAVGLNSYGYPRRYAALSGTSMATPMAAGLAALKLARQPALQSLRLESLMRATADDLGAAGRDDQFGSGRINAGRLLAAP